MGYHTSQSGTRFSTDRSYRFGDDYPRPGEVAYWEWAGAKRREAKEAKEAKEKEEEALHYERTRAWSRLRNATDGGDEGRSVVKQQTHEVQAETASFEGQLSELIGSESDLLHHLDRYTQFRESADGDDDNMARYEAIMLADLALVVEQQTYEVQDEIDRYEMSVAYYEKHNYGGFNPIYKRARIELARLKERRLAIVSEAAYRAIMKYRSNFSPEHATTMQFAELQEAKAKERASREREDRLASKVTEEVIVRREQQGAEERERIERGEIRARAVDREIDDLLEQQEREAKVKNNLPEELSSIIQHGQGAGCLADTVEMYRLLFEASMKDLPGIFNDPEKNRILIDNLTPPDDPDVRLLQEGRAYIYSVAGKVYAQIDSILSADSPDDTMEAYWYAYRMACRLTPWEENGAFKS